MTESPSRYTPYKYTGHFVKIHTQFMYVMNVMMVLGPQCFLPEHSDTFCQSAGLYMHLVLRAGIILRSTGLCITSLQRSHLIVNYPQRKGSVSIVLANITHYYTCKITSSSFNIERHRGLKIKFRGAIYA